MSKLITKGTPWMVTLISLFIMFSSVMLLITSETILQSQSAYAYAENKVWYFFIHFGMIMLFFLLNALESKKYMFGVVAFASLATVALDMFEFKIAHNLTTASIFLSACYCMIFYTFKDKLAKNYISMICGFLAGMFLISVITDWFGELAVLKTEMVIEFTFGIILSLYYWFRYKGIKIKIT